MNPSAPSVVGEHSPVAPAPFPGRVVAGVAFLVAVFDFCFWNRSAFPGLSLAVFFGFTAVAIRLNRTPAGVNRLSRMLLLLLAATLVETVIETGFCNVLMLLLLTLGFAGETFFMARLAGVDRWLAQLRALTRAPLGVVELVLEILSWSVRRAGVAGFFGAMGIIVLPSAALLLLFGALLANGNDVFGAWMQDAFQWIWRFIPDISFWRLLLWFLVATTVTALLAPSVAPPRPRGWDDVFARWNERVPTRIACFASAAMLVTLNALFAVANYADAAFLWHHGTLPAGVTYSDYVHNGVEMLTFTVLLSALVLASIFNQSTAVTSRRELRLLAAIWIMQNLFLLLSVARRLDLYVESFGASVERFSTLLFLLLVAVGFGLLAVKIGREKSLAWLLGRALLASFVTLYLAQFLNIAGWVADYNVARWEHDRSRNMDMLYLEQLGPAAWPALVRAEKLGAPVACDAGAFQGRSANSEETVTPCIRIDDGHWREFSLRAWWNRGALQAEADNK